MSRSIILGRVRQALAQARAEPLPLTVPEFPQYPQPVETFREELEGSGGIFLDGRQPDQLADLLCRVMKEADATEIYWETEGMLDKHGIPFARRKSKVSSQSSLLYSYHFRQEVKLPLTIRAKPRHRLELARISISASSARFGVAETGTVVHAVRSGVGRLLSVLPPSHLVLLSEGDLLMNQKELFSWLRLGEEGSALTLVTGPSRTADIEKMLVMGVHGPKQLFVMLTR